MKKPSTIEFNGSTQDYLVDGKLLLPHLAKHEGIGIADYIPALIAQPKVTDRLAGAAKPDIQGEYVAIYLCGMCGGYDGNPIGTRVELQDDAVRWTELGFYSDYEGDGFATPFKKVREYVFERASYDIFITHAQLHAVKDE